MSATLRSRLLIRGCCNKGDDYECKAEDEAKDAAHNIDHDQCNIGKPEDDRVARAAWTWSYVAQLPQIIVIPKHPVTAKNDPDEEEKGETSFEAVPGRVDVVSLFIAVVLEEAFDDVDGRLYQTDRAEHNQPYWDDGLSLATIDVHTPCMISIYIHGRVNRQSNHSSYQGPVLNIQNFT